MNKKKIIFVLIAVLAIVFVGLMVGQKKLLSESNKYSKTDDKAIQPLHNFDYNGHVYEIYVDCDSEMLDGIGVPEKVEQGVMGKMLQENVNEGKTDDVGDIYEYKNCSNYNLVIFKYRNGQCYFAGRSCVHSYKINEKIYEVHHQVDKEDLQRKGLPREITSEMIGKLILEDAKPEQYQDEYVGDIYECKAYTDNNVVIFEDNEGNYFYAL